MTERETCPECGGSGRVQVATAPVSVPSREPATPTRHSVENKTWADDLHRARIIESVAEIVYDAMRSHDPEGSGYPWITGGNSDKQDDARVYARRILKAIQVDPERAPSAQAHHDIGQRHHREAVSGSPEPPRMVSVEDFDGVETRIGGPYNEAICRVHDACLSDENGDAVILTATEYWALRARCSSLEAELKTAKEMNEALGIRMMMGR